MCTVCGCGSGAAKRVTAVPSTPASANVSYRALAPAAAEAGVSAVAHEMPAALDFGSGPAGAHAPGLSQRRMVRIERDILGKNDEYARANRDRLHGSGILALNLVSSPGAGKTTLLVRTLEMLRGDVPVAVIEGDQQTSFDAERIRATGVAAIQINTGKGCHLDAHMVGRGIAELNPRNDSVLMIENVGNLVCPAAFDLGETHKVVVLSVTEGDDKPLKYPDMFAAARLMLINKCDLLPYVSFDVDRAVDYARRINPGIRIIRVSATRGDGLDEWLAWIAVERATLPAAGGDARRGSGLRESDADATHGSPTGREAPRS